MINYRNMSSVKALCQAYQNGDSQAIVMRSHVSLVRNLRAYRFPCQASRTERKAVDAYIGVQLRQSRMFDAYFDRSVLDPAEVRALQDLDLLGSLSCISKSPRYRKTRSLPSEYSIFCSCQQPCSVTLNEENHICIRASANGLQLEKLWKPCVSLDDHLDDGGYAFSEQWGYLTANPQDVGTGMRASILVHLPGLMVTEHIEHLAAALQQIGIVLRGIGGMPQTLFIVSNTETLGIEETEELRRLKHIVETIVEQEQEARKQFLAARKNRVLLSDWIGRIYGTLRSSYQITQEEAQKFLAWMRFAIDVGMFDEHYRTEIDRCLRESQSGVLSVLLGAKADDCMRSEFLKKTFQSIPEPKFLA